MPGFGSKIHSYRSVIVLAGPLVLAVCVLRLFTFGVSLAFEKDLTSLDLRWDLSLTKKVRFLLINKNQFDGLLVGNSTLAQVNPQMVDREIANLGKGSLSYNLSLGATTLSEMYLGIEALLQFRKYDFKWIVLDASLPPKNLYRQFDGASASEPFQNSLEEVLFYTRYFSNAYDLMERWLFFFKRLATPSYDGGYVTKNSNREIISFPPVFDKERGFLVLKNMDRFPNPLTIKMLENYKNGRKSFEESVQSLMSPIKAPCDTYRLAMIKRFVTQIRKADSETKILLLNPPLLEKDWTRDCELEFQVDNAAFINLQDPVLYPEFYVYEDRWDKFHFRENALPKMQLFIARKLSEIL